MKKHKKRLAVSMVCLYLLAGPTAYAEELMQNQEQVQQDQNRQLDKIAFTQQKENEEIINTHFMGDPLSPFQVFAGTVIPCVLVTGLNSDLPGMVVGQVSQNVFDSQRGQYLLIPQGTKVIGVYDSKTTFAQSRALVIWQRLIFPNGKSIILDNFTGADQAGYSGFKDKVRSHFGRVIWSALLGGAVTAGVASQTDSGGDDNSFRAEAGAAAAQNFSKATDSIVNKNLNIQPTIIIRPGCQFNILCNKDVLLEPYIEAI